MSGALPGAILKRKHHHTDCTWRLGKPCDYERAGQYTNCSGARHSNRCTLSQKGTRTGRIPTEIIKSRQSALLKPLLGLLQLCWEEGRVLQDIGHAKITTLYKNKGERCDCNNYHGISLLSFLGKAFARVILSRLQTLTARIYPESQCGFRPARSTIDMILCKAATRKMRRIEQAHQHGFHRPDESLRPC